MSQEAIFHVSSDWLYQEIGKKETISENVILYELKRKKRKAETLDANNCEITCDETNNEIRDALSKNEKDKGLREKLLLFHNIQEIWEYLRDNACKHGVYMLCKPQPHRGYAFQ